MPGAEACPCLKATSSERVMTPPALMGGGGQRAPTLHTSSPSILSYISWASATVMGGEQGCWVRERCVEVGVGG